MILLALAVLLFSLIHLVPALPEIKSRLKDRFGAAYGPLFGVAATLTLVGIVLAWSVVDSEPVYQPLSSGRYINMAFTFVAFLLLGVFFFRGTLRQTIRYPFALAVVFWAVGHLIANGDQASIILFGGLLVFAVAFIILGLRNQVFPSLVVREGHDVVSLLAGASTYGAMVQLHEPFIGVPIISIEQLF